MSILDDARRLVKRTALRGSCWYCGAYQESDPHGEECPVPSMPRIVAALEATQALVESLGSYVVERNTTRVAVPLVEAIVAAMKETGR
jgi:hypothetical protein